MVIAIAGGIFGQRDVRETPASSSSANNFTFDTNDFLVTAGDVALANKTSYWSAPGCKFEPNNPDIQDCRQSGANGVAIQDSGSGGFICGVELPHGAVITAVVVYGSNTGNDWEMRREALASTGSADNVAGGAMAMNTEDSSISNATVDNSAYRYWFLTSSLSTPDTIYSARITYTTDYI